MQQLLDTINPNLDPRVDGPIDTWVRMRGRRGRKSANSVYSVRLTTKGKTASVRSWPVRYCSYVGQMPAKADTARRKTFEITYLLHSSDCRNAEAS